MTQTPIRVLIVDDHAIVRKGTRALLATERDIEVVGEADNGADAVALAQTLHPSVILMDLVMPRMDGIEATRQITSRQPEVRILVLTSFAADDKVFPAIRAGALGYLLKDTGPDDLVQAIHQVHLGQPSLEPSIARKVLSELSRPPQEPLTLDPLTERELDVLRLIAKGINNSEIANQLHLSEGTVRNHVSAILEKLGVSDRTQAAVIAIQHGL